ncbi:MAG: GTPase HflX [Clostridia bacterium]|nr:GTPase HflX [Clostridia bacterium]
MEKMDGLWGARGTDAPARAVLVGVCSARESRTTEQAEISLAELARLLETAGGEVCATLIQNMETVNARTYIGSGKVKELGELCRNQEADLVVFDDELSPVQIRNIEDDLDTDVRVIDRSMLILDIFAFHAVTAEGKVQVELAQLQYTAPRLTGKGTEMSRLGGGIGTRGPGESKLESDRRHRKRRETALREQLRAMEQTRAVMRRGRDRSGILRVAIVGYTNAGKSTLLNTLTGAGILAEDKLFATLDPTTRKYTLPSGQDILLTDTVGFIRKLPHHLVEAFHSTLEEAVSADLLLLLLDASDPEKEAQLRVSVELLKDLGAEEKPWLMVYNKCDQIGEGELSALEAKEDSVCVSCRTGYGLEALKKKLEEWVASINRVHTYRIPNDRAGLLSRLYTDGAVEEVEYGPDCILVRARTDEKLEGKLGPFRVPDGMFKGSGTGTNGDISDAAE